MRTFSSLLNRLGYRLRSVKKCLPIKKIPQTDAIFANVRTLNQAADASPETVRVSVDCKATVAVGDYSRDGQARGCEAVKAADHDMAIKTTIPGILSAGDRLKCDVERKRVLSGDSQDGRFLLAPVRDGREHGFGADRNRETCGVGAPTGTAVSQEGWTCSDAPAALSGSRYLMPPALPVVVD